MSTIEELLGRNSSSSGPENREYGHRDPSRWPCDTLCPQRLALTSPTNGGNSVSRYSSFADWGHRFFFMLACSSETSVSHCKTVRCQPRRHSVREVSAVITYFVIERTGTAFRHLFSTDFQSFNPMSDESWTKLWNLLWTFAFKFMLRTEFIIFLIKDEQDMSSGTLFFKKKDTGDN
jgi:hypothetical protein